MNVLFVEDDERVADGIRRFFERQPEWHVQIARDGSEVLRMFDERVHNAVLIDWNLPRSGPDGLEVCRRVRQRNSSVVIVFVTARDAVDDIVEALDAGADEYVTKPFDARALLARVSALVRRSSLPPDAASARVPNRTHSPGPTVAEIRDPTRRQAQILANLAKGMPNKEIANRLGCSVKNVEYHVGRILRKAGCASRAELIAQMRNSRVATLRGEDPES